MVALGLLLLLATGVLTAAVVLQNTDAVSVSAYGQSMSGLSVGRLFLAGVIAGAIAILGLTMILAGAARRRTRRVARRRQALDARGEKKSLAEENTRLQRELDASRSDDDVYPTRDADRRHVDADATEGRHGLFHR